jgi:hypothetical protein
LVWSADAAQAPRQSRHLAIAKAASRSCGPRGIPSDFTKTVFVRPALDAPCESRLPFELQRDWIAQETSDNGDESD